MNAQLKLGEIITQIRGVSYKPSDVRAAGDPDAVALLRANNIQEDGLNFDDLVWVDKHKVSAEQYLRMGDILICSSSGSKGLVGKAAIVTNDLSCAFGAFCKVVRTKAEYASYLGQFFRSPRYRKEISTSAAGANINNIRNEHIDDMFISMPSENERAGCVAKLGQIDYLIQKRNNQTHQLDQLVKSRFVEMFEKNEFEQKSFDSFCEFLRNGASIKQTKGARGYPITRIETLANDVFNPDRLGYANITELNEFEKYILQKGDILISHINSVAYLGRAVQYRGELNTSIIHGMNLLCARLKKGYDSTYVEYFFKTPMAKDYISTITKKAVNQASITTTDLKKMPIPAPPLELQHQFAAFVAEVDKSKLAVKQSLEKLETLKKSLMQQYFG